MKTKLGFMLAALLTLAFGLAGPAWGNQCDRELPRCIKVITLTEQKVSFQNKCNNKVAVYVEVIGGYGSGVAYTRPQGRAFVYDETTMYPKPGQKAVYSQDLKCCTDREGYFCDELN